jgi:hypothetical protein
MSRSRDEEDDLRREFPREGKQHYDRETGEWYTRYPDGRKVYDEQKEDDESDDP